MNQPIRVQYIPGEEEVFMVIHVIIVRVLHPDPEWFRRLAVDLTNEKKYHLVSINQRTVLPCHST